MNPKLFDIHAHVNFPDFDKDRGEVIKRALDNGVWIINIGSDYESSKKAVEIAERYNEGVYAAVGFHPNDNKKEIFDINKYFDLAKSHKVVSVGECGIDLFRQKKTDLKRQKEIFLKQMEMASELDKPLMIHCRDAHSKVIEIVSRFKFQDSRLRGNIHFFSGTWEQAQKYFDLGFTISFTGVLTYDVGRITDIVSRAPVDKIMVETDAPFVAPIPYRGQRNEPFYVQDVAKKMAEIRGISYEEIARATTVNALKLFLNRASI